MDQARARELQAEADAAVDAEHENDVARRNAIAERSETLGAALLVATQLNDAQVTPEVWKHTEDDIQERGIIFRRPRVVGSKTVVAAMGWPLIDWLDRAYEMPDGSMYIYDYLVRNHLLLGTDGKIIALQKRDDKNQFEPAKELGRVPVEGDPVTWLKKQTEYPPEESIFELGSNSVRDFGDYKKAKIEERLRDALAQLAAENLYADGSRRIAPADNDWERKEAEKRRDLTVDGSERYPADEGW